MDFMPLLKGRVGLPGSAPKPEQPAEPQVNDWAPGNMAKGIGQVKTWLDYAVSAITLNRDGYAAIARDAYMTAPALLIESVRLAGPGDLSLIGPLSEFQ